MADDWFLLPTVTRDLDGATFPKYVRQYDADFAAVYHGNFDGVLARVYADQATLDAIAAESDADRIGAGRNESELNDAHPVARSLSKWEGQLSIGP